MYICIYITCITTFAIKGIDAKRGTKPDSEDSKYQKIVEIRLWEVEAKQRLNGTSKVNSPTNTRTNTRTNARTDISNYRENPAYGKQ